MKKLLKLIKQARFIWICGNGGSAATAEHLSNDLFSKKYRAICLNSNTSIITMIANDFGYDYIFADQLAIYGRPEDLLITISCSGTSPNIVTVVEVAECIGMKHYEFPTMPEGSKAYGKYEDKHMQLVHKIKDAL
jgi:phosphoheptose isomerase